MQQALHHLVQRLPGRLRYVVVARYGLDGNPPATYCQIGAALGPSGKRARQLHTEALIWLHHPARSQTLRSLLGRHTLADYQTADVLAQRWPAPPDTPPAPKTPSHQNPLHETRPRPAQGPAR